LKKEVHSPQVFKDCLENANEFLFVKHSRMVSTTGGVVIAPLSLLEKISASRSTYFHKDSRMVSSTGLSQAFKDGLDNRRGLFLSRSKKELLRERVPLSQAFNVG